MNMQKRFANPKSVVYPLNGDKKEFAVKSVITKDNFFFNCERSGKIELKFKNQLRQKDFLLARLDINGPNHTNPDGVTLSRNHIHIYKEGYGYDRLPWAYEFLDVFGNNIDLENPMSLFDLFCNYCNIELPSMLQGVVLDA